MNIKLKSIVLTLVLAAIVHVAAVLALPNVVMKKAIQKIGGAYIDSVQTSGGDKGTVSAINKIYHSPSIDVTSRKVVAPSPDLVYSAVIYDVTEKPLLITVPIPDTYWSISFFADNTDNYFVKNDRQLKSNPARFVLVGEGQGINAPPTAELVKAVTNKGIILFRSLVKGPRHFQELDRQRRSITIKPL